MSFGALSRQSRRRRSDSSAHLPSRADLIRAKRDWLDAGEAIGKAQAALAAAEQNRDAVDADVDPGEWHRRRAERETTVVEAVRELERLTALEATLRQRARDLHDAHLTAPIRDRERVRGKREARIHELAAALQVERTALVEDDDALADLREEREEALHEFIRLTTDDHIQAQARRQTIDWFVKQARAGLPTPVPAPGLRRAIARATAAAEVEAVGVERVPYEESEAAKRAGITRLGSGPDAAPFPR